MNRPIKFRGKRTDNGEWAYGYYIVQPTHSGEDGHIISIGLNAYFVDPETVGQYTGLTDRNGKEVYEGDIVECLIQGGYSDHFVDLVKIREVKFNTKSAYYMPFNVCRTSKDEEGYLKTVKVLGNIYTHPHLLEVQANE